jgi:uncharacterized membrane protein
MRRLHRFLDRYLFYPALLSSALSAAMFAGRVAVSGDDTYGFMIWNLILAWIPYLCSLWAAVVARRYPWWGLPIPALLWLLFLPNAPYMVTDFLHLHHRPPVPVWYDSILLTSFAWTGCYLAVASLRIMQALVDNHLGQRASWAFVGVTLVLTGFGIYLGRFLDWNSWDLFTRPGGVLSDVLPRLLNPLDHPRTYGVTILFAAFLFVFYVTFVAAHRRAAQRAD